MISRVMDAVQTPPAAFTLVGCTVQHRGDRAEQQDRVAILRGRRAARCALGLLADGLGGRSGGALAAEQVIATAQQRFDEFAPEEPADRFFEDLVRELHLVIQLGGATSGTEPHSTVAAVLVRPERVDWCHIGDSRMYHVRDGRVRTRTVDDTYLEQLVAAGRMSAERARLHPSASRLTQALGGSRPPFPNLGSLRDPRPGDAFVLCSDGAWSSLSDAEIAAALGEPVLRDAGASMLALARQRAQGQGDNCSLVMLRLEPRTD
jgi:serine/threonine protein phosphatase PrpC